MKNVFIKKILNNTELSTNGKPEKCLSVPKNGNYWWLLHHSFRSEGARSAWLLGSRETQGIFLQMEWRNMQDWIYNAGDTDWRNRHFVGYYCTCIYAEVKLTGENWWYGKERG